MRGRARLDAISRARSLRRCQTEIEQRLWPALRGRRFGGIKFRRQMPIGRYIVDFACPARHLIVELDGGQHATQAARDEARTRVLEASGYRVLRFWNNDVSENLAGVLTAIEASLGPSPRPSPPNGGEGAGRCEPSPPERGRGKGEGVMR